MLSHHLLLTRPANVFAVRTARTVSALLLGGIFLASPAAAVPTLPGSLSGTMPILTDANGVSFDGNMALSGALTVRVGSVEYLIVGGGGSGGSPSTNGNYGGGGKGGARSNGYFDISTTLAYTVVAGGGGNAPARNAGSNGRAGRASSLFGISAAGGAGGANGSSGHNNGANGVAYPNVTGTTYRFGAEGGDGLSGTNNGRHLGGADDGGDGAHVRGNGSVQYNATAGANTGGGGGGGAKANGTAREGADGGAGIVYVHYYGESAAATGGTLTTLNATNGNFNRRFTGSGNSDTTYASGTTGLRGLTAGASQSATFTGNLSGSNPLIKAGLGKLILAGTNSYTTTTISAGTLQIGSGGASGTLGSGTVSIASGANLTFNRNNTYTLAAANTISGAGSVTQAGTGTTQLNNLAHTYTGATTISAGVLEATKLANGGSSSSLGSAAVGAGNLVLSGGTLKYSGAGASNGTTNRLFTLGTGAAAGALDASGAGGSPMIFNGAGSVAFSGAGTRTLTLTGSNTDDNELGLALGDNGGATSLTKSGGGNWILSGANSYTGATTVSAGTLYLAHASSNNIASSGTINVASGATLNVAGLNSGAGLSLGAGGSQFLKGKGVVAGDLTIGPNGVLAPGNSVGTINSVGDVFYADGGSYLWEINNATGTQGLDPGWDLESITGGSLNITATPGAFPTNTFKIAITSLNGLVAGNAANFNKYADYTWTIATSDTSINGFAASNFTVDPANFLNDYTGTLSAGVFGITTSGNNLQVTYAHAADIATLAAYWTGDAGSSWNTLVAGDTNWAIDAANSADAHAVPDGTSDVFFTVTSGAANFATTLGADFAIKSLTFTGAGTDAATNSVTIGGGNTLTLGSGGITVEAGSAAHTLSTNVALNGTQIWTNNGSNLLTVAGDISNGASGLTIDGAGDTTLSGVLGGGSGGLMKNGGGTLTLAGNNTFTGGVQLNAGQLNLNAGGASATNSALGTGAFVINGGTLDNTSGSPVTLATNNVQTWNADVNFIGSNDLNLGTGAVTLAADRLVTVGASTLSVGGAIGDGGNGYGLTKDGAGTLVLSGASTFTGSTTVSEGTLQLTDGGLENGAISVASGATFQQTGGTNNVTGAGSGNLTLAGSGAYQLQGGTLNFGDYAAPGSTAWTPGDTSTLTTPTGSQFEFSGGSLIDVTNIVVADSSAFTQAGGDFYIGQNGLGPAAETTIAGDYLLLAGALHFDAFGLDGSPEQCCDGAASMNDQLTVLGDATLDSVVSIDFVGFTPEFGDVFTLLCADNLVLGDNFALTGGYFRVVSTGLGEGFPQYALQALVPEPASVALWSLVGLLGAAGVCRRRRAISRQSAV